MQEGSSRLETALVVVSHLLVSSNNVDMQDVLREIADATDASSAFLSVNDWRLDNPSGLPPSSNIVVWHRDPASTGDGHGGLIDLKDLIGDEPISPNLYRKPAVSANSETLTLPLLGESDRFVGFLGVVQTCVTEEAARTHGRILSVFGDLLSSYLTRTSAELARRESEERSRKLLAQHPDPIIITHHDRVIYANRAAAALFGVPESGVLLSYRLLDFIPADRHPAFQLQQYAQRSGELNEPFEQEIVRIDGAERVVEAVSTAVTYKGLDSVQTVLRDITERKTSEERYRNFVTTISEGVFRIDVGGDVRSELSIDEQALRIARFGTLAECNSAMIAMMNLPSTRDYIGRNIIDAFPAMPMSLLEAFVANGYRLENHEFAAQGSGTFNRHFSVNAVGRIDRGRLFRIWGSCIEITARVEMERRMVAVLEEEQERIGRDLHDGVGQLLTGIRMLSENLSVRLPDEEHAGVSNTAKKISSFALEASQRVRDICRGLAPPQLSQEALGHSLEALCGQLSAVDETMFHFEWNHDIDVGEPEVKIQLFRIAQEAVNNALRHSQATNIHVRLVPHPPDFMLLEIRDDGIGFDVTDAQRTSLGLYSMQRRASSVRAQLDIDSRRGEGTCIRATYRLPRLRSEVLSDVPTD